MALLCLLSFSVFGETQTETETKNDKQMQELFVKYDKIMKQHKVELVDEVFTEKFLKENGGKEAFIEKVKELPKEKRGRLKSLLRKWKKSKVGKIFFAEVKDEEEPDRDSQFVIVEEDGKLKIDGTVSDAH